MRDIDYIELLKRHDQSSEILFAADFNRGEATAQALVLAKELKARLKAKAIIDSGAQVHDATYHTEISFPEIGRGRSWVTIRLSNFGSMATIINSAGLEDDHLQQMLHALSEAGYVYIPENVLNEPYTGSLPQVDTWMTRFFHYL